MTEVYEALAIEAESGLVDAEARTLIRGALDRTMLVEAAAGTGKTTELVLRMVALLASGRAEVEEIVAVTFTEKAAGELKLRLRSGIERARRQERDEGRRANLERALAHLEEARISTIHGFCADLLRERPVEARVDPLFRVMTEAETERRFSEAFSRFLDLILEKTPPGIRRFLRRREQGAGPIERLRRIGQELIAWRYFSAPWRRPAFDRKREIDALVADILSFAELSEGALHESDPLHRSTEPARALAQRILVRERESGRDDDELEAELCVLGKKRDFLEPRKGAGSRYGAHATRADLLSVHQALAERLRRFEASADADLAAALQEELGVLVALYQQRKAETGALDFEDLLVCTRNLLRENQEVRRAFQERYRSIFVDEFQDTDPLQAEILMLLAADDPSVSEYRRARPLPGKLFFVGDPKQAIYRFRRADLSVYEEVKALLLERGALYVELVTSFRSVPGIQAIVNAAFAPHMTGDREALTARYSPLHPARAPIAGQPSIIALPVPEPYGKQRLTSAAIEKSAPQAIGALLDWILHESGFQVIERDAQGEKKPVAPRHICLLFRRFETHGEDVTRAYVEALEARGIPHVLVGGKSFYAREEVETMIAALRAIERPDDELAVFATLRGSLFAVGDEALLEYRSTLGKLHPKRIPESPLPPHLQPIATALALLGKLSEERNAKPIESTIAELCDATRAYIGFALRPSGERALANVLHLAELGRAYEASSGTSFRAFVEELEEDAERGRAPEAPILEEGGDGVRIMTAHRAKGLEFPIVVLADITARLGAQAVGRYVDASRSLCALRLGSVTPWDLAEHEAVEMRRDEAEGVRLCYVAATRARDLLIVPAVGDDPRFPEVSWVSPIHAVLAPKPEDKPSAEPFPGAPAFGEQSVLKRPEGAPKPAQTVRPGHYAKGSYDVVWWDIERLDLAREPAFGVRREDMLRKDAPMGRVEEDLETYRRWARERPLDRERGARPMFTLQTVTERAEHTTQEKPDVPILDVGRDPERPKGMRFGELVHAVLAATALDADEAQVQATASLCARLCGAREEEERGAASAVTKALAHPLLIEAREADQRGECRRETPLSMMLEDGTLLEGIVDLAYRKNGAWTVIDFKTDRDLTRSGPVYRRQVAMYAEAIERATGETCEAILLRV